MNVPQIQSTANLNLKHQQGARTHQRKHIVSLLILYTIHLSLELKFAFFFCIVQILIKKKIIPTGTRTE